MPLLAAQPHRTERPANDHRTVLGGILWILRSGVPWRDLPERDGPWQRAVSRFRRWGEAVYERMRDDTLVLVLALIEGSGIRAHQHAAKAPEHGGSTDQELGRSRGGWDSTRQLGPERVGKPIISELTSDQGPRAPGDPTPGAGTRADVTRGRGWGSNVPVAADPNTARRRTPCRSHSAAIASRLSSISAIIVLPRYHARLRCVRALRSAPESLERSYPRQCRRSPRHRRE